MDMRKKDEKGLIICPNCKKHYQPVLGDKEEGKLIQEQFPNATAEEREQLVSGLCSTECWMEFLGGGM